MNMHGEPTSPPVRLPEDDHGPRSVAVGSDGKLWITGTETLLCATVDGQVGSVAVPVPDSPRPSLPEPLICFDAITRGPDGNLWLVAGDCFFAGRVVRIHT
jgi:hypothetical protein